MLELDGRSERRGNEIHHDSADFVVNILLLIVDSLLLLVNPLLLLIDPLLQRSLTKVLDVAGMNNSMRKPDTPSSHHEYPQPDPQVEPRSRYC